MVHLTHACCKQVSLLLNFSSFGLYQESQLCCLTKRRYGASHARMLQAGEPPSEFHFCWLVPRESVILLDKEAIWCISHTHAASRLVWDDRDRNNNKKLSTGIIMKKKL